MFYRHLAYILFAVSFLFATNVSAQPSEDLKIATIERKPFSFKQDGEWTGFSVELWSLIANSQDVSFEFIEMQSFKEMLSAVEEKNVDIAVANISVTASREKVMDFSRPIFDSGLTILARADQAPSIIDAFLKPQLLSWIAGAILLFMTAGFLISLLERGNVHFKDRGRYDSFREGVWWAVSVVTNASFTIFTPFSAFGRALSYGLILAGLFVVSAFVAQITASLTVEGLRSQITGLSDLNDKNVATTAGSTASRFMQKQAILHDTYDTLDQLYVALEQEQIDAIVHDAPLLAYYSATEGRGKFALQGGVFQPEKYGFALPQFSQRTEIINQEVLRLKETGEYADLVRKWFGNTYR